MRTREDIQKELEERAPYLAQRKKEQSNGFKLPPDYFDGLADRVLEKAKAQSAPVAPAKQRQARLLGLPKAAWAAAASVLLLLAVAIGWWMPQTEGDASIAEIEQFSEAEVLAYLDENADGIDLEVLVESHILNYEEVDFTNPADLSEKEEALYLESLEQDIQLDD